MSEANKDPNLRRPLKSRSSWWAKRLARLLTEKNLQPNHVSVASIVVAALGGVTLAASAYSSDTVRVFLLLFAACCVQGRLLCNLLDGMVAIEGGKQTKSGAFYNEFPDRISDILILLGFGISIGVQPYGIMLGGCSVVAAILTSYTRALGASLTGAQDYSGPMAKQHRMAAVTISLLLAAVPLFSDWQMKILIVGNWIVIIGSLITLYRRVKNLLRALERA